MAAEARARDGAAAGAAEPEEGPLYLRVARALEDQIRSGVLRVGDRVPSIRELRRQRRVSASTVLQAYLWLESRGRIEARPRSGFYVRTPFAEMVPEPAAPPASPAPTTVGVGAVLGEILRAASDPSKVPFGAACPGPDLLPNRRLNLILRGIARRSPFHSARYEFPPGAPSLRRQIARRSFEMGCSLPPDEIVVTCGAMQALNLCLMAVARKGDVVAVESPTYFGILQAIEALGLRAVEVPAHPRTGIDLDKLDDAARRRRLAACIVQTSCHNPLGAVMPDDRKRELAQLAARRGLPVIEDDVYGDLVFEGPRPVTAKAFDRKGLVLLCSSFSKVLAPGFRIGWVHAGRFTGEVLKLMFLTTVAAPSLPQLAVAEFLAAGGYDRHIRRLRRAFAAQVQSVSHAVGTYFPRGTRVTRPAGGYLLWVEMPERVDALAFFRRALAAGVSVLPGPLFSAGGAFRHHIRVSCGHPPSEAIDRALRTLGRIASGGGVTGAGVATPPRRPPPAPPSRPGSRTTRA
jgi:DNA-binding transcriptional MocR family regulator